MIAFLFSIVAILNLLPFSHRQPRIEAAQPRVYGQPAIRVVVPEFVTHLPAELPQRASGLAYDGEKFWVMIYLGGGRYATFNPNSMVWDKSTTAGQQRVIADVSGSCQSPGGVCFAGSKLWVAGSYGDSFGSVDPQSWKVENLFKGKLRDNPETQSYSSMACDGTNLWIVWHWFKYDLPTSQTQLLLKVDPETGKVVAQYPAPAGTAPDGTHGLTWDGTKLWHAKDNRLSAIDPTTGRVIEQYVVDQIKRPSGLAWDGTALWIVEFNGDVWKLRL